MSLDPYLTSTVVKVHPSTFAIVKAKAAVAANPKS